MRSGKKIGIMGGTFNPIHNGHLQLAMAAQEQASLDQVLFMPSGNSYMKRNVLETQKRVDMVALAIAQYPNFELSLVEAQKSGNTYTCETLKYLTTSNPDVQYYFIIGADILFQIEQWRNPEQIYQLAVLVCAVRDDYDFDAIQKKGNLLKASGADIIYLNMPKSDISSTDIRAKVKSSLPISKLVPPEVAHYIEQEHLYYEED
ncbi:MAG: nicotinate-nucleotide adenylyltransferase [Lachnospiraceae bacterium]|jgi:nicotinate-nucleotide adenylyltransferase|nr:nicotinate-nucleotide adenylyltransferase [Lachnospiraceae bacterium]